MKQRASAGMIAAAALALTGCGETKFMDMLGSGGPSPSGNIAVQTNQNLAMPPDLRLPPPGTATSESQVVSYDTPEDENQPADQPVAGAPVKAASTAPARPVGDIYERNGISKIRADGKPKSDGELQAELKRVYLAKKRQTEPNYGTIWNLGNLFKDG